MTDEKELRAERLSLLIGTMIGQISEILNHIKSEKPSLNYAYSALFDVQRMASMQIHELYYKGNKRERTTDTKPDEPQL